MYLFSYIDRAGQLPEEIIGCKEDIIQGILGLSGTHTNGKIIYPKWNGMTILSKNARTMLIVPISTELLNVSLLKTVSPIIKTTNSKTERASKYPHPYTKVMLNNTAKINIDSINAGLLFPFAYQQINAKNREIMVKPHQIIA